MTSPDASGGVKTAELASTERTDVNVCKVTEEDSAKNVIFSTVDGFLFTGYLNFSTGYRFF
jgi:hypothetical protein